jgi:hypothetical protein
VLAVGPTQTHPDATSYTRGKEKTLRVYRGTKEKEILCKSSRLRIQSNFSTPTMEVRKKMKNAFTSLGENDLQPEIQCLLNLTKLSIRMEDCGYF